MFKPCWFAAFLLLLSFQVHGTIFSFDALNRLTSVVYSPSQRIDYVYDAAGNLIEERINGAAGLTVTAQPNPIAGGTVAISPAQSSFVAGDVVTVTATPTAGYNFTGWSGVSGCTAATACTSSNGFLSTSFLLMAKRYIDFTNRSPIACDTTAYLPVAVR